MSDDTEDFDVILRNALIVDGTGAPARPGELAILGDRIAAMGDSIDGSTYEEIDMLGQVVAPGFIDVHATCNEDVIDGYPSVVSEGVTTVILGDCGDDHSQQSPNPEIPWPLGRFGYRDAFRFVRCPDHAEQLERHRLPVNVAAMIGTSTPHLVVTDEFGGWGGIDKIPEKSALLTAALDAGAVGFFAEPSDFFAGPEDVSAVLAGTGAVYATHIRGGGDQVPGWLEQALEAGRSAGAPVLVSLGKGAGHGHEESSVEILQAIEAASASQPIALCVYPYAAGAGALDPQLVDLGVGIQVTSSDAHPRMAGRSLAAIASEWRCSLEDAARRLEPAGAVYFQVDDSDVRRMLSYPQAMIGSLGLSRDGQPHPRLPGTFPLVIGHYARDEGLFGIEEAVRRMTSLPAETFGLDGRGVLAEGNFADIAVFDPKSIADRAAFETLRRRSAGIGMVFVNGRLSHDVASGSGGSAGRLLRRTPTSATVTRQ